MSYLVLELRDCLTGVITKDSTLTQFDSPTTRNNETKHIHILRHILAFSLTIQLYIVLSHVVQRSLSLTFSLSSIFLQLLPFNSLNPRVPSILRRNRNLSFHLISLISSILFDHECPIFLQASCETRRPCRFDFEKELARFGRSKREVSYDATQHFAFSEEDERRELRAKRIIIDVES